MAKKYYSLENIKKINADFKILLSGRNIGKSYAVKHDVIKECFENGCEFVYLRRWKEDIKTFSVERYLGDLDVKKITNGKYTNTYVYQSKIYLCNMDDNLKPKDKFLVGYVHSLNQSERYKSQMYLKVKYVIYEEFITDKGYLPNEPSELQDYISTIFRENKGVVYMIGNTISKLCPYFNEWKLQKVETFKPSQIGVFENEVTVLTQNGETTLVVRIAVERCTAIGILSKMAFGDSANMITKNSWKSHTSPRVSKEVLEESENLYSVFVRMDNLFFRMDLLKFNDVYFWYVRPQTKKLNNEENERVISQNPTLNNLHTVGFTPLSKQEQIAFNMILDKKVFFCSDSCGSDFMQVLKKYRMVRL